MYCIVAVYHSFIGQEILNNFSSNKSPKWKTTQYALVYFNATLKKQKTKTNKTRTNEKKPNKQKNKTRNDGHAKRSR